jgi:hypothetical protein
VGVKVAVELAFLTLSGDSALANQPASVGVEIAVELALIPLSCKKTLLLLPPTTTTITTTIIIIKHLQIKWYGCCMAYIYIYIYIAEIMTKMIFLRRITLHQSYTKTHRV